MVVFDPIVMMQAIVMVAFFVLWIAVRYMNDQRYTNDQQYMTSVSCGHRHSLMGYHSCRLYLNNTSSRRERSIESIVNL